MSFPVDAPPAQVLYPDLDQELATTRAMIALVPDGNNDWRPHAKSYKLGALASHLVELPGFASMIVGTDGYDFMAQKWAPAVHDTTEQRLEHFDKLAADLKSQIESASWDDLAKTWTLRAGDTVYMSDNKAKLLRTIGLSHMAHHRAQLGMYLRQNDVAIPGSYGPSADES